jgi:hypothetical protein
MSLTPDLISHVNFPSSLALTLSALFARLFLTPTSITPSGPAPTHSSLAHSPQTRTTIKGPPARCATLPQAPT